MSRMLIECRDAALDLNGQFSLLLLCVFFFNDTPTTEIYTVRNTLSLHDALPITRASSASTTSNRPPCAAGRSSAPRRSEEHTSELQSLRTISYAVFCLTKNKNKTPNRHPMVRNLREVSRNTISEL